MKKVLLLLAFMPFLLLSCSSSDEDNNTNDTQKEIEVVGIWKECSPSDNSFISLANDGTYKIFASRNNSVGFFLDAGHYSVSGYTLKFQSAINQSYEYTFTLNNGNLSLPLDNGHIYTFKRDGKENNAITNTFIGKKYKGSEGGYMWVGGTDYGTIEFNNGYLLTYTVTTVKDKITKKETRQTYNYLFHDGKFYIQQPLGYYICTYTINRDVLEIKDADGKHILK